MTFRIWKTLTAIVVLAAVVGAATGCGPGRYHNKGIERYNEGRYDKALSEFRKTLEKDKSGEFPDTPDWVVRCYLGKALAHFDTDIHAAVADCTQAVREAETLNASQDVAGEARDARRKYGRERDKRVAESKEHLASARLEIKDKDSLAAYKSARDSLEEALRLDPRNLEAKTLLGRVNTTLDSMLKAENLAGQGDAILADEGSLTLSKIVQAKSCYDRALLEFEKCEAAQNGLKRIEALVPTVKNKAEEHFRAALALERERKWDTCVEELNECLRLDYTHGQAGLKLADTEKIARAARRYKEYMAEVSGMTDDGIDSVEEADKGLRLCRDAIKEYEYNQEAKDAQTRLEAIRKVLLGEAQEHFRKGMAAKKIRDYEKARDEFRLCISKHIAHPDAAGELAEVARILESLGLAKTYVKDGNTFLDAGKPYEAEKSFRDALDIVPGMPEAEAGMNRAKGAIKILKAEALAAFNEAELLIRKREYADALVKLDEAVLKDPAETRYPARRSAVIGLLAAEHYNRGKVYEAGGEWDRAAAEYEIAASYDGRYDKDLLRVLNEKKANEFAASAQKIYIPRKDWYNAATLYREAMNVSVSRKNIFRDKMNGMLGKMMEDVASLEKKGEYYEALALLDKVAGVNRNYNGAAARAKLLRNFLDDATVRYNAATKAGGENRFAAAAVELETILKALPEYKDAKDLLAIARKEIDTAKAVYDQAVRFDKKKEYKIALDLYEDCVKTCADYRDAAECAEDLRAAEKKYHEGVSLVKAKKLVEALDAFEKVAAIRKDYEDVQKRIRGIKDLLVVVKHHYDAGVAAQKKKNWSEAIKNFEEVLKIVHQYKDTAGRLDACKKAAAGG